METHHLIITDGKGKNKRTRKIGKILLYVMKVFLKEMCFRPWSCSPRPVLHAWVEEVPPVRHPEQHQEDLEPGRREVDDRPVVRVTEEPVEVRRLLPDFREHTFPTEDG